jgi:hypothetical protein
MNETEQAVLVRTSRITFETDTLMVIRRARAVVTWCPDCHAEVDVITFTSDSFPGPATVAQLQQWLGVGKLHLWQPTDSPTQICVPSLLQCFDLEEIRRFSSSNQNPLQLSRRNAK